MAVTDLTDSLPYWARQGVGYGGGPGPTGGPGSAPMGAGNSASWLQYLQQMFGPQAAQAAENDPMAALRAGGSPVPSALSGGGPAVPQSVAMNAPTGPGGGIGSDVRFPLTQQGPDYQTQQPDPRLLPASAAPSAANPLAVAGPGAAGPVAGPLASGGATGAGASANPRFVGLDYRPNASPQNSMRGGPQATALNLAGLFGGGGGVNPNVPAANAQPVSGRVAGPLAGSSPGMRAVAPSGDDWDIDPTTGEVVPKPNVGNIDLRSKAPSAYGPLQRGRTWGYKGGIPT